MNRSEAPDALQRDLAPVEQLLSSTFLQVTEIFAQILRNRAGTKFSTFEERQAAAHQIGRILESISMRCRCTTCGEPAILKAVRAGNSKHGVFQFDHTRGRRSSHSGSVDLPLIELVPEPKDGRKK
ncbi:hypothetical protein A3H16_00975 [Candidatus Kaiserbacteria bacterium RIFCSPLOWO2_12_FULL_53_8]|uniref:Uncharacterized protein n=1 Tax=Candidatus Kaiserbacteria bacterium RIFCSPLOWO2_12_FULL_53_8 TaxID=1798529 RepID=A0A1F6G1X9_9BACT|nr:MAG: hypothetical protein A3H16_00975 [Candidatus Kaiserbacteria bacterium RIFCSPLOWO2_12_FULL_53_8]